MAIWFQFDFLTLILFILVFDAWCENAVVSDSSKQCTYFGNRLSSPESSLVNCSWYAPNACCKRTEVTSVFSGMYTLHQASPTCYNQMNYLMCYFCSPEQYKWYDIKATVCEDFCNSVYEECKSASYQGKTIGEEYATSEDFCKAQNFATKPGKDDCFDFDPNVFDTATLLYNCWTLIMLCIYVAFQFQ